MASCMVLVIKGVGNNTQSYTTGRKDLSVVVNKF